jgi:hypothetical protein
MVLYRPQVSQPKWSQPNRVVKVSGIERLKERSDRGVHSLKSWHHEQLAPARDLPHVSPILHSLINHYIP